MAAPVSGSAAAAGLDSFTSSNYHNSSKRRPTRRQISGGSWDFGLIVFWQRCLATVLKKKKHFARLHLFFSFPFLVRLEARNVAAGFSAFRKPFFFSFFFHKIRFLNLLYRFFFSFTIMSGKKRTTQKTNKTNKRSTRKFSAVGTWRLTDKLEKVKEGFFFSCFRSF